MHLRVLRKISTPKICLAFLRTCGMRFHFILHLMIFLSSLAGSWIGPPLYSVVSSKYGAQTALKLSRSSVRTACSSIRHLCQISQLRLGDKQGFLKPTDLSSMDGLTLTGLTTCARTLGRRRIILQKSQFEECEKASPVTSSNAESLESNVARYQ